MCPEAVTDVIAASTDTTAIRALLANPSAAIRESTLDALIGRAALQPDWHAPLVHRPSLSDHAARALSEIVAAHLLEALANRTDLRPETIRTLKSRLAARLAQDAPRRPGGGRQRRGHAGDGEDGSKHAASSTRRRCWKRPGMARRGGWRPCWPSPPGCRCRWWSAPRPCAAPRRWSAWCGRPAIPCAWPMPCRRCWAACRPRAILHAAPDAGFPLGTDEMAWQIEFLASRLPLTGWVSSKWLGERQPMRRYCLPVLPGRALMTTKFGLAQPVRRVEDPRLLKGGGRYNRRHQPSGHAVEHGAAQPACRSHARRDRPPRPPAPCPAWSPSTPPLT